MNQSRDTAKMEPPPKLTVRQVWKSYRLFRRSVLALENQEEYLAADLYEMSERAADDELSSLGIYAIAQSLKGAGESCADALEAVRHLRRSLPHTVLDDEERLRKRIEEHLPDVPTGDVDSILGHLSQFGGARSWFALLEHVLAVKKRSYQLSAEVMHRARRTLDASAISSANEILEMQHRLLPDLPDGYWSYHPPSVREDKDLDKEIRAAITAGKTAIKEGKPGFLAGARVKSLLKAACVTSPNTAADWGSFCAPTKPTPIIICLVGAPGIAICLVAAALALSSHNVEDDDGGDDDEEED